MLEQRQADYVAFARARGIPGHRIYAAYVLRNALIPLLTASGLIIASSLTATVFVEDVFGIPGLGGLLVTSVENTDIPVIQGLGPHRRHLGGGCQRRRGPVLRVDRPPGELQGDAMTAMVVAARFKRAKPGTDRDTLCVGFVLLVVAAAIVGPHFLANDANTPQPLNRRSLRRWGTCSARTSWAATSWPGWWSGRARRS